MEEKDKVLAELSTRIEQLTSMQLNLDREIKALQKTIFDLRFPPKTQTTIAEPIVHHATSEPTKAPPIKQVITEPPVKSPLPSFNSLRKKEKAPWEEFIGTNLLNKIGIIILVVGVGFGVKFAIDHQLINPLTRVISGYFWGTVLILTALRLKRKDKYKNFSAVLLSGGMAILYFITYAAYDLYALIPVEVSFVLMVVFTAFTVLASIHYDRQVIAIIGMVGAYAVPFLLSDGSGRVVILFSYIAIINAGILTIAFRKAWKKLNNLGFILTWLIFSAWHFDYNSLDHEWIGLLFSTIFFITFYVTFLAYKIIRTESLGRWDIFFTLANSFIYFGWGYDTINTMENGDTFLGLFTVFNAILHFIVASVIYKTQQHKHQDTFYFVAGLVLVFLTIAVPVQLEGNWVTLVWAAEALLLFWIGRTKRFSTYEKFSYPLIVLAFISLVQDWLTFYENGPEVNFLLNVQLMTSLLVAVLFILLYRLSKNATYSSPFPTHHIIYQSFTFVLPCFILTILYFAFYFEVGTYWDQEFTRSVVVQTHENSNYSDYDYDLLRFKSLWLINYSALFAIALAIMNMRYFKNQHLTAVSILFNALVLVAFITSGLWELSQLRSSFLEQQTSDLFNRGYYHILIRYISLTFILPLLYLNYRYLQNPDTSTSLKRAERIAFHLVVLILLSSELVHWLNMNSIHNSFKFALSILWGAYALFLIVVGIWKHKQYLRVTGMLLFGFTIAKLFIYDMADMTTIAKTIVMIVLGILLLIASFLYNKYKDALARENE